MGQTAYVRVGQVLISQKKSKYYRQSNLEGLEATVDGANYSIEPNSSLFINDLTTSEKPEDKFVDAGVMYKMGTQKAVRIFNIVTKKDGDFAVKVACDQIIAYRDGQKVKFSKGDWLNFETKEKSLEKLERNLKMGYIDDEEFERRVERLNKRPDFVHANIVGKGELV